MRSVVAGFVTFAGNVAAHPGHGALEGHFHWVGIEHGVLLVVVLALLAYAVMK
jgi:hypothetical protein